MRRIRLLLFLAYMMVSCQTKDTHNIIVHSDHIQIDSIFISNLIPEKVIAEMALSGSLSKREFRFEDISTGKIQFRDRKQRYLTILRPNKKLSIHVGADSTIRTNHLEDSLLTYLWKSNNEFLAERTNFIFNTENFDSIVQIFNDLRLRRQDVIEYHSKRLPNEISELLHFQNDARIYSFLFYYGRVIKKLHQDDKFFNFIYSMDHNGRWIKTFPHNTLYRYEIEYLKKYDSINSLRSFLSYIEDHTENADLADFLKSIYLTEVIEQPYYWEKHNQLFNSKSLQKAVKQEIKNPYRFLFEESSHAFFSTRKGKEGYNFIAEQIQGKKMRLSDFKGKIVFIDNWATWCGPCVAQRPNVLQLAKKYKDNPNIVFLMVSLDSKRSEWLKFVNQEQLSENNGTDLWIDDGMKSAYGQNYNIKFIPKYMMLDDKGVIVDSNLPEPSLELEKLIERELREMD